MKSVADPMGTGGIRPPYWDPKKGQFYEKIINLGGERVKKWLAPIKKNFSKKSQRLPPPFMTEFWIRHWLTLKFLSVFLWKNLLLDLFFFYRLYRIISTYALGCWNRGIFLISKSDLIFFPQFPTFRFLRVYIKNYIFLAANSFFLSFRVSTATII